MVTVFWRVFWEGNSGKKCCVDERCWEGRSKEEEPLSLVTSLSLSFRASALSAILPGSAALLQCVLTGCALSASGSPALWHLHLSTPIIFPPQPSSSFHSLPCPLFHDPHSQPGSCHLGSWYTLNTLPASLTHTLPRLVTGGHSAHLWSLFSSWGKPWDAHATLASGPAIGSGATQSMLPLASPTPLFSSVN